MSNLNRSPKRREVYSLLEQQASIGNEPFHVGELEPDVQEESAGFRDLFELHKTLLEVVNDDDLLIEDSSSQREATPVEHQAELLEILQSDRPDVFDEITSIIAKMDLLNEVVSELKLSEGEDTHKALVEFVNEWEKNLKSICIEVYGESETSLEQKTRELQEVLINYGYKDKLVKITNNKRGLELLNTFFKPESIARLHNRLLSEIVETAGIINTIRIIDRLQKPLTVNARARRMTDVLEGRYSDKTYEALIEKYSVKTHYAKMKQDILKIRANGSLGDEERENRINELHHQFLLLQMGIIEDNAQIIDEESERINIFTVREGLKTLQADADRIIADASMDESERKTRLYLIDEKIQQLLIPVVNKFRLLFPHKKSTALNDILENEEAVCAGKVNALLQVMKVLGLESKGSVVERDITGGSVKHTVLEVSMPSNRILVIDANYQRTLHIENEEDLLKRTWLNENYTPYVTNNRSAAFNFWFRQRDNDLAMESDSDVLMYFMEKGEPIGYSEIADILFENYTALRTDPYTGELFFWRTSVPYPHKTIYPDRTVNTHLNSAFMYNAILNTEEDELLYKFLLMVNPYFVFLEPDFIPENVNSLGVQYDIKYLLHIQALLWEYDGTGDNALLPQVIHNWDALKASNPELYVYFLYMLDGLRFTPLEARLKEEVFDAIDNPTFYANVQNIELYEKFIGAQNTHEMSDDEDREYNERRTKMREKMYDRNNKLVMLDRQYYIRSIMESADGPEKVVNILEDIRNYNPYLYFAYISYGADAIENLTNKETAAAYLEQVYQDFGVMPFVYNPRNAYSFLGISDNRELKIKMLEDMRDDFEYVYWQSNTTGRFALYIHHMQELINAGDESFVTIIENAKEKAVTFWDKDYLDIVFELYYTGYRDYAVQILREAQVHDKSYNDNSSQLLSILNLPEEMFKN